MWPRWPAPGRGGAARRLYPRHPTGWPHTPDATHLLPDVIDPVVGDSNEAPEGTQHIAADIDAICAPSRPCADANRQDHARVRSCAPTPTLPCPHGSGPFRQVIDHPRPCHRPVVPMATDHRAHPIDALHAWGRRYSRMASTRFSAASTPCHHPIDDVADHRQRYRGNRPDPSTRARVDPPIASIPSSECPGAGANAQMPSAHRQSAGHRA